MDFNEADLLLRVAQEAAKYPSLKLIQQAALTRLNEINQSLMPKAAAALAPRRSIPSATV